MVIVVASDFPSVLLEGTEIVRGQLASLLSRLIDFALELDHTKPPARRQGVRPRPMSVIARRARGKCETRTSAASAIGLSLIAGNRQTAAVLLLMDR